MAKKRLNEENVRTLPCPAGKERVIYFDTTRSAPPGFGLRVRSTAKVKRTKNPGVNLEAGGGSRWSGRSYVLKYYVQGSGLRSSLALGDVGDISIDEARRKGDEASKLAADGIDPRFVKSTDKTRTIATVCADYIGAITANSSKNTIDGYMRLLKHVVKAPELRAPVDAIEDSHVSTMLKRITGAAGPYAANRVFNLISSSLRWARGTRKSRKKVAPPTPAQKIKRNPCAEMTSPNNESKREHALADGDAVRLWRTLDGQPAEVAAFIRFVILTALRRNEASFITWRDYNAGEKLLIVPGEYRKGGRAHVVFLAPLALDVLNSIGPGKPDAPIFGEGGARFRTNESRLMGRIKRATAVRDPENKRKVLVPAVAFTLHDLRRTCASGCAKTGADETMVSRILGHAVFAKALPVTLQYITHKYAVEHRAALARWAAYLENLLGIERPAEKVVAGKFGTT